MITLDIPEATPSLNRLLGEHWARKHRVRNLWHLLVTSARLDAKVYDRPQLAKARVTIERYGARILDADNCRAGTKFLTDALVKQGLLLNDTPAVIGEPLIRQIISKQRRTVVRIEAA